MKIAVTGANGHIGSQVCRELVRQGYEVRALVHKRKDALEGLPARLFEGDLLMKDSLRPFLENCDGVIHAGGIIRLSHHRDTEVYNSNFAGTKNILEISREAGLKRFVYVSSIEVFEQKPVDKILSEERPFAEPNPVFYSQTKKEAHKMVLGAESGQMEVSVICPTSVVGPPDYGPSKIGKAILDIYNGAVPAVIKGGFDFVDVRDLATGIIAALRKGRNKETYIFGGGYQPIKAFSDLVLKAKGTSKKLPVLPVFWAYSGLPFIKSYAAMFGKAPLYDKIYLDILRNGNHHISSEKARKELGFRSRNLESTIADTVEWFKEKGFLK